MKRYIDTTNGQIVQATRYTGSLDSLQGLFKHLEASSLQFTCTNPDPFTGTFQIKRETQTTNSEAQDSTENPDQTMWFIVVDDYLVLTENPNAFKHFTSVEFFRHYTEYSDDVIPMPPKKRLSDVIILESFGGLLNAQDGTSRCSGVGTFVHKPFQVHAVQFLGGAENRDIFLNQLRDLGVNATPFNDEVVVGTPTGESVVHTNDFVVIRDDGIYVKSLPEFNALYNRQGQAA